MTGHDNLGARYVAVKHSAAFFEARAKFWRRWALITTVWLVCAIVALAWRVLGG